MSRVIALVPTDLKHSRLGLPSLLDQQVLGRSVLAHTVSRLARIQSIDSIILVHPAGQSPLDLLDNIKSFPKPVECFADENNLTDDYHARRTAARKWALTAWRGGLGGMTCYDELLPARPLAAAMNHFEADSALLVGSDWMLVDPGYCKKVLQLHLKYPEQMAMTFTQAPPGLAGVAIGRKIIDELADKHGTIGAALSYQPTHPQADPIGRDVCIQVEGVVRSCARRFIYDTPRSAAMIDAIAGNLDNDLTDATARDIVNTLTDIESAADHKATLFATLPQQVTIELTPQRTARGPITPQHYISLDCQPISLDKARDIFTQIARAGDVALTLGHLGDPLLHPQWREIIALAREAGVFGLAVQTDLLCDEKTLQQLFSSPVDIILVRANANSSEIYEKTMGLAGDQGFAKVEKNLAWMLAQTQQKVHDDACCEKGLPWIVPQLIKTPDTFPDMEMFFDRWTHFAGQAVIAPAQTGQSAAGPIMPDQSPIRMAPPARIPCRQLHNRMTILSSGHVALCDQDWLGQHDSGSTDNQSLTESWQSLQQVSAAHDCNNWNQSPLCEKCLEWHRP